MIMEACTSKLFKMGWGAANAEASGSQRSEGGPLQNSLWRRGGLSSFYSGLRLSG